MLQETIYTYTVGSNGTCPDDTATITIMISEDIIDKECKVIDADFCDSSTDPFYNFYWGAMNSVSGSAFFSQDATHTLNFTQFNNGTAIITGTTQQNGCSAELYIFLEDKKDWTQWTADGGTYKSQGCAGTIKEQMQYYVIDGSRSFVKTTGACVEEGTYIITQRPDPNDLSTPNLGVHVGPGGALWDSNQGAEGLAGWAWMGPQGDEQRWRIDFNFLLDCEEKVGCIIDDPEALDCEIAANVEDVNCNGGNDGSATVMVTGGLPPYTYLWSNGETSMTVTNLTVGTHTVTVVDSENTVTECKITIAEPKLLECTVALVNGVSASGISDGSATVTPTGGTADFTYLWDNNETTQTATSLSAGTHMVTVTDANGCETNCSVDIPQPGRLACEASGTDVSCYDGTDGTATVTPMGGLAPYSYSWSNGDTTLAITGLAAGTYEVTVSDANGRNTKCEIEIFQPKDLSCIAIVSSNVSTNGGSDGVATVTPEGGTLPYTYLWDNGETAAMAEALDAGVHTVTVTDANGCMTECSVEIMQPIPNALECEATGTNVACYDGTDGTATVTPMGGLAPYSYSWSNGDTTQSITGLPAGTYEVTVSDANGRNTKCEVEILQPREDLSCSITDVVNSNEGESNGEATASPSGGTAPYTYLWNDSQAQTTATATGLAPDNYTVTTTDANGCETSCMITIEEIPDGGPVTGCETAFARDAQTNTCFLDDGFNRWGWTNFFENEGDYIMDLYSGAGQCNLTSGEKSGNVQVAYNGGFVTVTIELLDGFVMQEAQLYIGGVKYPTSNNGRPTVAPGQFPYNSGALNDVTTYEFDPVDVSHINGGIYVIVHAVTCKKSTDAGKVTKTAVTAYPMTFKNDLNLRVDIPYDAQLEVEMFDVNGKCVMTKKGMNVKAGSNNVNLDVSNLAPDMYFLILRTGREKIIKKVMSIK